MSSSALQREPIDLLRITLPKCGNRFGCAPCRAGLGDVYDAAATQHFVTDGLGDWFTVNATATKIVGGGVHLVATSSDPQLRITGFSPFSGADFNYVVIHGKWNFNLDEGGQRLELLWGTVSSPGFSSARRSNPENLFVPFRDYQQGGKLANISVGEEFVAIYDFSDDTAWTGEQIRDFRFDPANDPDADVELYSITVCSENPRLKRGSECYNTRATCQDVANYRAIPWEPLGEPDIAYAHGEDIPSADFLDDNDKPLFWTAHVEIPPDPEGTIFEAGGGGNGIYVGFTGDELVFRAGNGGDPQGADGFRVAVDADIVAGTSFYLAGAMDLTSATGVLYRYCTATSCFRELGRDSGTAAISFWTGGDPGKVGDDSGGFTSGEDGGPFNGDVISLQWWFNNCGVWVPGTDNDFRRRLHFQRPEQGRPDDNVQIYPLLGDVGTVGSKINIAGSDEDYEPLGGRAVLQAKLNDAPSSDIGLDPYLTDRSFDPVEQGTFWTKFRVREKFGKLGAVVDYYEGYAGERLSDMLKRTYITDATDFSNKDSVRLRCRDVLTRSELRKAQVPNASTGVLLNDISETETTLVLANAFAEDYPAPGYIRINDEVLAFSSSVTQNPADPGDVVLTVSARGQYNTIADEHSEDDAVQLCKEYLNQDVYDVLVDLLADQAGIEYQYLDLATWRAEVDENLNAYTLSTLITKPTEVKKLVGELAEQCAFLMWWDERAQLVSMRALQPLKEEPIEITERGIIAGSFNFRELPDRRLSRVWFFFNQVDPTKALDDASNYAQAYADTNLDAESLDEYRTPSIKTIYSRWLRTNPEATQTASRYINRFEEVPTEVEFALDSKDRELWVGDTVLVKHRLLVDQFGNRATRRFFFIIEAEEDVRAGIVKYVAVDSTLAGFLYRIVGNSTPDYDPGTAGLFDAFITDADGLYSNGDRGTRIS